MARVWTSPAAGTRNPPAGDNWPVPNLPYKPGGGAFPRPDQLRRLAADAERLSQTFTAGEDVGISESMGTRQFLDQGLRGFWGRITGRIGSGSGGGNRYGFVKTDDGATGAYPDLAGTTEFGTGLDVTAYEVNGRADVPSGVRVWIVPNRLGPDLGFYYAPGTFNSASSSGCAGTIYQKTRYMYECRDGNLLQYEWDETLRQSAAGCIELVDSRDLGDMRSKQIGCCECPETVRSASPSGSPSGTAARSASVSSTGTAAACLGCPSPRANVTFAFSTVADGACGCAGFNRVWDLDYDADFDAFVAAVPLPGPTCPEDPPGPTTLRAVFFCTAALAGLQLFGSRGEVARYFARLADLDRRGVTAFELFAANADRPGACAGFPPGVNVTVSDPDCDPAPGPCVEVPCCPGTMIPRTLLVSLSDGVGLAACLNGEVYPVEYQGVVGGAHEWVSDCLTSMFCRSTDAFALTGQRVRLRCEAGVWRLVFDREGCPGSNGYEGSANASWGACPSPATVAVFRDVALTTPELLLGRRTSYGVISAVVTPPPGVECPAASGSGTGTGTGSPAGPEGCCDYYAFHIPGTDPQYVVGDATSVGFGKTGVWEGQSTGFTSGVLRGPFFSGNGAGEWLATYTPPDGGGTATYSHPGAWDGKGRRTFAFVSIVGTGTPAATIDVEAGCFVADASPCCPRRVGGLLTLTLTGGGCAGEHLFRWVSGRLWRDAALPVGAGGSTLAELECVGGSWVLRVGSSTVSLTTTSCFPVSLTGTVAGVCGPATAVVTEYEYCPVTTGLSVPDCCPARVPPGRLYATFSGGTGDAACLDGIVIPLDAPAGAAGWTYPDPVFGWKVDACASGLASQSNDLVCQPTGWRFRFTGGAGAWTGEVANRAGVCTAVLPLLVSFPALALTDGGTPRGTIDVVVSEAPP